MDGTLTEPQSILTDAPAITFRTVDLEDCYGEDRTETPRNIPPPQIRLKIYKQSINSDCTLWEQSDRLLDIPEPETCIFCCCQFIQNDSGRESIYKKEYTEFPKKEGQPSPCDMSSTDECKSDECSLGQCSAEYYNMIFT